MTIPCPVATCDRPRPGHRQLCGACEADLTRALGDVPWLAQQLDITLARQGSHAGGGRSANIPLPYDPRATEAAYVLRSRLVGWVRVLGESRVHGPRCASCGHTSCWLTVATPEDDLAAMARWLLARGERLVMHAAAEEAVDEICSAVWSAIRLVDRLVAYVYAGPCANCGASMFARPGATIVRCRPCKVDYEVETRREWMREQCEDLLGSPSYVAMICTGLGAPVSPSTVRVWISRKKILPRHFVRPMTEDGKPRPLYRVGDVLRRASGHDDGVYSA